MITLITGAPGAGKTNALVSLLAELAQGRALYVSGVPDLAVPHVVLDDPTKWHDVVEDGAAVVIDEVQRVWRPNRSKVTDDIAALETHRHRGIDFFIVTQGPNLLHGNVRALVGRHVHIRDTGITGRWWYEWPEVCENVTTGWKQAPNKKLYRLDKKAQALYTSASQHVKPIRTFPRAVILLGVALVAFAYFAWKSSDVFTKRLNFEKVGTRHEAAALAPAGTASAPSGATARADLAQPVTAEAASAPGRAEGAASAPRLAGCIRMSKRCECLDGDGYVMTMALERCELNAGRTGDRLPYSVRPSPALANLLDRTPDITPRRDPESTDVAALSPRAAR